MRDEYDVAHRVWQVSDTAVISAVQRRMREQKLVIADGHHRYETALNFRDECREKSSLLAKPARSGAPGGGNSSAEAEAAHEFVMMTLVNMNDAGLLVLPTHRVVHSLRAFSVEDFQNACRNYFAVEEIDPALDETQARALLRERGRTGTALLGATATRAFLFHSPIHSPKHSPKPAESPLLAGLSERQRALDVVQLHKCLLEGVLKLSEESIRNQQNLSYVREASEALGLVRGGKADIAFLMNPCPVSAVRDVALAGEVMPQKSTDFYPKLLSGLTAYALD